MAIRNGVNIAHRATGHLLDEREARLNTAAHRELLLWGSNPVLQSHYYRVIPNSHVTAIWLFNGTKSCSIGL